MPHLVHIEQVFGYCSFQICALIFIDLTRALTQQLTRGWLCPVLLEKLCMSTAPAGVGPAGAGRGRTVPGSLDWVINRGSRR